MKSQGGEVVLEVEPHLQVVIGVESQGRDHSAVEPHLQVVFGVESQGDHSEVLGVQSQRVGPTT